MDASSWDQQQRQPIPVPGAFTMTERASDKPGVGYNPPDGKWKDGLCANVPQKIGLPCLPARSVACSLATLSPLPPPPPPPLLSAVGAGVPTFEVAFRF
jgi:hypothetical protein